MQLAPASVIEAPIFAFAHCLSSPGVCFFAYVQSTPVTMIVQVVPSDLRPETADRYFACGPLICPQILVLGGAAAGAATAWEASPASARSATSTRRVRIGDLLSMAGNAKSRRAHPRAQVAQQTGLRWRAQGARFVSAGGVAVPAESPWRSRATL